LGIKAGYFKYLQAQTTDYTELGNRPVVQTDFAISTVYKGILCSSQIIDLAWKACMGTDTLTFVAKKKESHIAMEQHVLCIFINYRGHHIKVVAIHNAT
jgi:hypothetical protein